jgi:hypothetical protein
MTEEEWIIKRGEIVELRAFPRAVEIAADVRGRLPSFTVAYSPKAPQKWPGKAP